MLQQSSFTGGPDAIEIGRPLFGKAFALSSLNDELMKQYSVFGLLALATAMTLSSCEVVGGIFKTGVWVGIFLVVLVVGLILWLVGRGRK